jgi:large subunit ribosomal protein L20
MLLKAKGFRGKRATNFRYAKDAIYKAQTWAYRDRKNRKRTFRNLWVQRINAACRSRDMTYSRFVEGLKQLGVDLDRKVLSDLAIRDAVAFDELVAQAKQGMEKKMAQG